MFRFAFVTFWTAMVLALTLSVQDEVEDWERAVLVMLPAFGALFMLVTWRQWRRRRSLRTEVENGATIYVWTDVDGRERRSGDDPRPGWDASDEADGDGGD
jgi:cyanate permease